VEFADVVRVLDELESHRVPFWVAGGWGVAALAAGQTRAHRDLDLAVDAAALPACLRVLASLGYEQETDWLPVRVEYAAAGGLWVDVHPVTFDDAGHGRQRDLDGGHFDYPPGAFNVGRIENRAIPCLSAAQQRAFHSGYEPRPQDLHDLRVLAALDEEPVAGSS
jgi:lincosamide nucleotidyltransferase A/C/D/E